jgi:hypothetical protein
MSDYSKWAERPMMVTSLLLDPKNPRIPELGSEPSQREIVAKLVEHDNVYELTKDIADLGFFPTEVLIGIREDSKDVIVEGNRRLAALKLLISPDLAPETFAKKFRGLSERVTRSAIGKVRVSFAPSREAAAPLIVNRHTGLGVQRWKPAQQAKYLRTLITQESSLEDLAKQLGMSKADLVNNLRTDTMYQIACSLDLSPEVTAVVRSPRDFNASVLERLVQSTDAMDFLGVEFDDRGNLRGKIDEQEFRKGYGRMVTDIASGEEDTRSLNKSDDIKKYLRKFGSDAPNKKRKGQFTSDSLLGRAAAPTEHEASTEPAARGGTRRGSVTLIPSGIKCRLESPRINDVFRELRKLKVRDFPNSAGVLLRIFAEMVLYNYLEKTRKIDPLLEKARTKDNKGKDWSPSFRQMLNLLLSDNDITIPPLARKGLNKMASDDDHPLSLDKLDQFVHNHYVAPTEQELRKLWALLQPLLVPLLQEPQVPSGAKTTK